MRMKIVLMASAFGLLSYEAGSPFTKFPVAANAQTAPKLSPKAKDRLRDDIAKPRAKGTDKIKDAYQESKIKIPQALLKKQQVYARYQYTRRGDEVVLVGSRWSGAIGAPTASADKIYAIEMDQISTTEGLIPIGDAFMIDRRAGHMTKVIRDSRGRQIGTMIFSATGFHYFVDPDHDGVADVSVGFDYASEAETRYMTESGERWFGEQLRDSEGLFCSTVPRDLGVPASLLGDVSPERLVSVGPCPKVSSGRSRAGGAPGAGGSSRSGLVDDPTNVAADCRQHLQSVGADSYRSGGGGGGLVSGGGRRHDPRSGYNYGGALRTFVRVLLPNALGGEDGQCGDVCTGLGKLPIPGAGAAAAITNAIGSALQAGAGDYVNDADQELHNAERNGYTPDPNIVEAACSAGSTSAYCSNANSNDDQDGNDNADGNDASGNTQGDGEDAEAEDAPEREDAEDNTGQPIDKSISNAQLKSEFCLSYLESQWARENLANDTSYVRQKCVNPASQSQAVLRGQSGFGMELNVFCSGADSDETSIPTMDVLRNQMCGSENQQSRSTARQSRAGDQDSRCSGWPGSQGATRGRSDIRYFDTLSGIAVVMAPCPDATCNPPIR